MTIKTSIYEELGKKIAEEAMDGYIYEGKTLREWINILAQTQWVPVSERLPEDGQIVLFCDIDDDIMVGYHIKGRPNTHFSQDGTYEVIKNVRAWMPLPEPYKDMIVPHLYKVIKSGIPKEEIIHCKDCKYRDFWGDCNKWSKELDAHKTYLLDENMFCGFAERKE